MEEKWTTGWDGSFMDYPIVRLTTSHAFFGKPYFYYKSGKVEAYTFGLGLTRSVK
jgi:hypothetical protein